MTTLGTFDTIVFSDTNFPLLSVLPYKELLAVQRVSRSTYLRISDLLKDPHFLSRYFNSVPLDGVMKAHTRFLNLVRGTYIVSAKITLADMQKALFIGPHLLVQDDYQIGENKFVYPAPKFNTMVTLQSNIRTSCSFRCLNQDNNIVLSSRDEQEFFALDKPQALPQENEAHFYFPLQKSTSIASGYLRFSNNTKTITLYTRPLYSKNEIETALHCSEEKYSAFAEHLHISSQPSLNLTDHRIYLLRHIRNRNRFFNCLTKEQLGSERIWDMMPMANFTGTTPLIFRNDAVFAITVPLAKEEIEGEASLFSWDYKSPGEWKEESINISLLPPLCLEFNAVTEKGFAIVGSDKRKLSILLYDVEKKEMTDHPMPVPSGHTIEEILSLRPDGGHLVITVRASFLKGEELEAANFCYILTQMPVEKSLFLGKEIYSEGQRLFSEKNEINVVTYNEDSLLYTQTS